MGKRGIVEISIEQVHVDVTGVSRKGAMDHALIVSLIYPRPCVALRECVKILSLEQGAGDFRKASWTTRILFKETVQGPFGLELGVSGSVAKGQVGRFISFLGASLLKFVGAEVTDDMQSPLGGGFVRVPFEHLSDEIKQAKKKKYPDLVARGALDLDPDKSWKKSMTRRVTVPLVAVDDIHKVTTRQRHGRGQAHRKVLLKAGEPNGSITLRARLYE